MRSDPVFALDEKIESVSIKMSVVLSYHNRFYDLLVPLKGAKAPPQGSKPKAALGEPLKMMEGGVAGTCFPDARQVELNEKIGAANSALSLLRRAEENRKKLATKDPKGKLSKISSDSRLGLGSLVVI